MSDLRLEMRLKNNALYRAIFPRWDSVAAFVREARAAGYKVRQGDTGDLLSFRLSPRTPKGDLRSQAKTIAEFLGALPEDLFPEALYARVTKSSASIDLDSTIALPENVEKAMLALPAPADESPDAVLERDELRRQIAAALHTLTFREREILKLRYGLLDGKVYTLEECAQTFMVTRERVRQIEHRAIRKLQHPARARPLEAFAVRMPVFEKEEAK